MDKETLSIILAAQQNEITEYFIYLGLAKRIQDPHNRSILEAIAKDEMKHYEFWRNLTHHDVKPNQLMVWWHTFVSHFSPL